MNGKVRESKDCVYLDGAPEKRLSLSESADPSNISKLKYS